MFGAVYFTPSAGIRVAALFLAAAAPAAAFAPSGRGTAARSAVFPKRVSPTANAGPSPASVVDSRLRPTTRGGGSLSGSGGKRGRALSRDGRPIGLARGPGSRGSAPLWAIGGGGGGRGGSRTSTRIVCSIFRRRAVSRPAMNALPATIPI